MNHRFVLDQLSGFKIGKSTGLNEIAVRFLNFEGYDVVAG